MAEVVPLSLTPAIALRQIRQIAMDSDNIIILAHGRMRQRQRKITRPMIEACLRKGSVQEGPFMNARGHWQVTLYRHAAGEELHCVVAIDWPSKALVITAF